MQRLYFPLSVCIFASLLAGCAPGANAKSLGGSQASTEVPALTEPLEAKITDSVPPASCPITLPQDPPFAAPEPYSRSAPWPGEFWYGSADLWVSLPDTGVWSGLPHNLGGYTQKVFWWRKGYVWNEEPEPALTVTGKRLDSDAPTLIVSRATNAYASDIGSAMLVGGDFPTLGCWEINGKYNDAELRFVVWVTQ